MRLRVSKTLLRQMSLMTLTLCSTLVMMLLLTEQLKKNIDNNFEKFLKLNLKNCEFGKSVNYMGHFKLRRTLS